MRTVAAASGQGGGLGGRHPVLFALLALDLGLVVLQYGLGMYVNLYVQVPFGTGWGGTMMGMGGMMGWMWGQPALVWHMMNGWIIFLLTLLIAVLSLAFGSGRVAMASWAALVSVVVAGTGGMLFMFSGGQNGDSYLMALGALGVLLSLSTALFLAWNGGAARLPPRPSFTGDTLELLGARYARGEIGREEYLRVKRDLTEA